ncbi:MAG: NAD-dependent malic enzyme [Candidatus Eremiobacteraeota bacterium]|nr:NAD-dependent malic enzyme [Candidatus Eremiobacteraeota bacterium]
MLTSGREPARAFRVAADGALEIAVRGFDVLHTPSLNKGTAFTREERDALGLVGLLPPAVLTIEQQAKRAYELFRAQPSDLSKNNFLSAMHDRNEILFYYLLGAHLVEMLPIVYTPTVGAAIAQFSHQYRRPRGIFLSIDREDQLEAALRNVGAAADEIDLIVATDAEAILGIGDWGVGGVDICVGKLAVYTAAAGVDPLRTLPVMLDVGTDRQSLLDDPLYLGGRHPRARGERYRQFIDAFIAASLRVFPNALLHWEDLAAGNARAILETYGTRVCTFNDDIQGTAGVVLAAVLSGIKVAGGRVRDQRIVIFGAGTAGCGIADLIRDAMVREGLTPEEAARRFWLVDREGLLVANMPSLREFQRAYARPAEEVADWSRESERGITLDEVVDRVHPTVLSGTSGQTGAFKESIVRAMARGCERPIILPLSNPTSLAEAVPADLLRWTQGKALIATGSPFDPVPYEGTLYTIAQANNAMIFPGLGLGTIVTRARLISIGMFTAAATAVARLVDASKAGAAILPEVNDLREVSLHVAVAVARQAVSEGLARAPLDDIERAVNAAVWQPRYRPLRAV